MAGHSLLRRIRDPALAAPRRVVSDDEVRASVLDHLQAMFTTRAGSALGASDYGILSVTDIVRLCPDAVDEVVKSIRRTVNKYEPRLANVRVTQLPGEPERDATIRFEITADLLDGSRRGRVKFETIIDATRSVRVL